MKAEKVFEVAGQKNVGMTVAYAISDGSTGYYAAKILAPNATYERVSKMTVASTTYSGPTTTVGVNPGT